MGRAEDRKQIKRLANAGKLPKKAWRAITKKNRVILRPLTVEQKLARAKRLEEQMKRAQAEFLSKHGVPGVVAGFPKVGIDDKQG